MQTKTGVIVSTKMAKTLVIQVDSYKMHPKYNKRFRVTKKFYAHTETQENFAEGQTITIVETRPVSKLKRWAVADVQETQVAA